MAETLALRPLPSTSLASAVKYLANKLKEKVAVEPIMVLEARREYLHEKAAREIKEKVPEHIFSRYSNHKPQLEEKRSKKELQIVLAESHEEAARELIGEAKNYALAVHYRLDLMDALTGFKTGDYGAYSREYNKVVIDMQNIRNFEGDIQFQRACLYMTITHEIIHSFGGFEEPYAGKYEINWLDEGITEKLARDCALDLFNRVVSGRFTPTYQEQVSAVNHLSGILGWKVLLEAFFGRSVEPIVDALKKNGFREEQINLVFKLGQHNSDYESFIAHLKEMKKQTDVKTERESSIRTMREDIGSDKLRSPDAFVKAALSLARSELGIISRGKNLDGLSIESRPIARDEWKKHPLEIANFCYYDEKMNKIVINSGVHIVGGEANIALLDFVFRVMSKKPEHEEDNQDNTFVLLASGIRAHLISKLLEKCGVKLAGKHPNFERFEILGRRMAEVMGLEAAKDFYLENNPLQGKRLLEEKLGFNANLVVHNPAFFDEAVTHASMFFAAIKQYPTKEQIESAKEPKAHVTFHDFNSEFLRNPYKATSALMSQSFPYMNQEYRSWMAAEILYLAKINGVFDSKSVALATISLSNSGYLFPTSLVDGKPEPQAGSYPSMFLHKLMLENMVAGKDLFEGIATTDSLDKKHAEFIQQHPVKERTDGVGYLYAIMFRQLSELLASVPRAPEADAPTFHQHPEYRKKIDDYMEKLAEEFSSDAFKKCYSRGDFRIVYDKFLETMLREFVLNLTFTGSYTRPLDAKIPHGKSVPYFEWASGINVPIIPSSANPQTSGHGASASPNANLQIKTGMDQYRQALRDFITDKNIRQRLVPEMIIADTGFYNNKTSAAWIDNVCANMGALDTFLGIGKYGIESCASRIFVVP